MCAPGQGNELGSARRVLARVPLSGLFALRVANPAPASGGVIDEVRPDRVAVDATRGLRQRKRVPI